MALSVRPVEERDIPAVIEMIQAMWFESPNFNTKAFSEQKATNLVHFFVYGPQGGGFVADCDGELIGMIAGAIAENLVTVGKYATDLAVYVVPTKRGGSILPRLVATLEKWAFANGADDVMLGISTGVHPEKTVYLYERLGYRMTCQALTKSRE